LRAHRFAELLCECSVVIGFAGVYLRDPSGEKELYPIEFTTVNLSANHGGHACVSRWFSGVRCREFNFKPRFIHAAQEEKELFSNKVSRCLML
jgi:hypothetical protein